MDGATLGGGASEVAVVAGASLTNGGAYVRVGIVVGAVIDDSTTVVEGGAGVVEGRAGAVEGRAGVETVMSGVTGDADVAVGGFLSSGA